MHTWRRAFSAGQVGPKERDISLGVSGHSRLCSGVWQSTSQPGSPPAGAGPSCCPAASAAPEGRMYQSTMIYFYWEYLLPATRMHVQQQQNIQGFGTSCTM